MLGLNGLGNFMSQMQDMQKKVKEMQENLAKIEVQGQSGAGLVNVKINGKFQVQSISVDDSLLEDKGMLEDLVRSAINSAVADMEQQKESEMKKITGGIELPLGMKFPGL